MHNEINLPEIQRVQHARAKRLKLAVSSKGIRLTIPPFATQQQIDMFMQQSQAWLEKTWVKQHQQSQPQVKPDLPEQLQFCFTSQPITIHYQPMSDLLQFDAKTAQLQVNQSYAEYALTQFVIWQAKQVLPRQLRTYAQRYDLTVNNIRIATPNTRWGSCSHTQDIMLHAGLLLMPQSYADYVFYHELAHTRHMHHQATFWQLLEQFYPTAKQIQTWVKKFHLPEWWQVKNV